MDTRLTIFFASTCLALIFNAVGAWWAYKGLRKTSDRIKEQVDSLTRDGGTREWLENMAAATVRAAELTTAAKAEIQAFEPTLIRAQEGLEDRLATVDHACERVCGVLTSSMDLGGVAAQTGFRFLRGLFSGARVASTIVKMARAR
ncbi:MAG TPA: hypothetical protein VFY29_20695 [Terriglobia bacterium]|nr:hypothetical protein [Terriglobia bacterium]